MPCNRDTAASLDMRGTHWLPAGAWRAASVVTLCVAFLPCGVGLKLTAWGNSMSNMGFLAKASDLGGLQSDTTSRH